MIDLIYNLALLVALSVVSGFVDTRWPRDTRAGALLQGLVFGSAAVIGMLRPLVLAPGLIFDGRSVVISLAALFFGPWTAGVACLIAVPFRISQGGPGVFMGVLVILCSAAIGIGFHFRRTKQPRVVPAATLLGFGLLVHAAMLVMTLALPSPMIFPTLKRIGLPVMLVFPLATLLIGKILSDQAARAEFLVSLRESEQRFRAIFNSTYQFTGLMTPQGILTEVNQGALDFIDARREEVINQPFWETPWWRGDEARVHRLREAITRAAQGEFVRYQVDIQNARGRSATLDFSLKPVSGVDGQVTTIIPEGRDITEHKQNELELRKEQGFTQALLDGLPGIFYLYTYPELRLVRWNKNHETLLGFGAGELNDRSIMAWHPPKAHEAVRQAVEIVMARGHNMIEAPLVAKDGHTIPFLLTGVRFELTGRCYLVGVGIDISDRKRAELDRERLQVQLRQAQKMESVGRLAGGVAHDFNNMLQVILGHASLALERVTSESPVRESLEEIQKSAQRSAELTRQLLAFARKQTIQPRVLDLNDTLAGMLKMLRRLIGENVELVWMPGAGLWQVEVDPSQIDQVVANLCVNARDAIAGTGKVTLETANVKLDATYADTHPDCAPGEYVMLAVSDTGKGMDADTHDHLFEPFFTTKGPGKGTGLGLATVFGIVRQNRGHISVYSELDRGSIFKIYLPRATAAAAPLPVTRPQHSPHGTETILLVEDEEQILNLGRRILEQLGYVVLPAPSPDAAEATAAKQAGPIHLLITDVVMPGMTGKELMERLRARRAGLKCLFMSGYTANVIAHHGVLHEGVHFLQKPFTVESLAQKVREVLEAG